MAGLCAQGIRRSSSGVILPAAPAERIWSVKWGGDGEPFRAWTRCDHRTTAAFAVQAAERLPSLEACTGRHPSFPGEERRWLRRSRQPSLVRARHGCSEGQCRNYARRPLGVDGRVQFAAPRDLRPRTVRRASVGRFVVARFGWRLLATGSAAHTRVRWWTRQRRRRGDRGGVALIGPQRSGKTVAAIAEILEWRAGHPELRPGGALWGRSSWRGLRLRPDRDVAVVGRRGGGVVARGPGRDHRRGAAGRHAVCDACAERSVKGGLDFWLAHAGVDLMSGLLYVAHQTRGGTWGTVCDWVLPAGPARQARTWGGSARSSTCCRRPRTTRLSPVPWRRQRASSLSGDMADRTLRLCRTRVALMSATTREAAKASLGRLLADRRRPTGTYPGRLPNRHTGSDQGRANSSPQRPPATGDRGRVVRRAPPTSLSSADEGGHGRPCGPCTRGVCPPSDTYCMPTRVDLDFDGPRWVG